MSKSQPNELTISEFLRRYPWRTDENGGAATMDYLWKFSLPNKVEDLWPFLIDTSLFNKMLGLPVMQYTERNGRLFGSSTNAGFYSEWEEVPWEWDYLRGLNNARIYSKGFARYVRTRYILERTETGTDLYVYFGWVPRHLAGKMLLALGMPRLRGDYEKALAKISDTIRQRGDFEQRQRALLIATQSDSVDSAARARLSALSERAVAAGADAQMVRRFADYIVTAPEEEVVRIRLKRLAREWEVPVRDVIPVALASAHAGMVSLSWDVTCPHCRGVRKSADSLGDVPAEDSCEACGITFTTESIDNLEVVFHVNPEIRRVEQKFYCAAEPATKRHILIQRRIAPQVTEQLETELSRGKYRLRTSGSDRYLPLSVGTGTERRVVIDEVTTAVDAAEFPELVIHNQGSAERTFILEKIESDNEALRPAEVFGVQLFRDLFGKETLAPGLKIELGRQSILFTDIVGSTKLYLRHGDGEAFASVRRHFQKTFEIMRRHGGAIVKTIGDSAMVAFSDPLQCIAAAVELQEVFHGTEETGNVLLRVSIHSGPCLAVNLNSGIDYFGNTVNFAAKLQQMAGEREIAYSEDFALDTRVPEYLSGRRLVPEKKSFHPGWSQKPFGISVLRIGS